jgi:hypothetical protein
MSRAGPTRVIRVRRHDRHGGLVLLDSAPQLAETMGRFPAARYVGHRRGAYELPTALLGDLEAFARVHDVLLIDDRDAPEPAASSTRVVGHARPVPECAACGQPARRDRQPDHCPACGATWRALEHQAHVEAEDREQCARCLAMQPHGFDYCQRCGTALTHQARPPAVVAAPRQHLTDPLPIGAAVDELLVQHVQ